MLRTTDPEFVQMKDEYETLKEKIDELENVIKKARKNQVAGVTLDDIHLMEEQSGYMNAYATVLATRISRVESGI